MQQQMLKHMGLPGLHENGVGLPPGMIPPPGMVPPPGLPPPPAVSPRTPASTNGLHTPAESPVPSLSPSHPPRPQSYSSNGMPESPLDTTSLNGRRTSTASSNDSNGGISLDTAGVSQRIREILSTNNIGQRLFAKHVLGLSQGTVSELLSKPKHWDKLTEKGRESYRKMHSWSLEENNILALKAISPRKGKESGELGTSQKID